MGKVCPKGPRTWVGEADLRSVTATPSLQPELSSLTRALREADRRENTLFSDRN